MKSAWIAAFALPILCSSLSHPQQTSSLEVPANHPSPEAKAADQKAAQPVLAAPVSSDEDLRQALVGKQLYLRGLYLDDDLHFDMFGNLDGHSPTGSFTLCAVEIQHVRLTKRRVELEGVRYGIHFADEGNWAEQATSFDRMPVTQKKKHLVISIDRQQVIVPKKKKGEEDTPAVSSVPGKSPAASPTQPAAATTLAPLASTPGTQPSPIASAPAALDDPTRALTTQDPAKAAEQLESAVNRIFAPALDASMIAQMPDYWRYFYQAQLDHKSIEPTDPNIVRPGPGIEGPKLLKNLVASSNDYAQKSQVAGIASYKVILDSDGKPMAVAVFRPIGFGLDENAVAAIQKSKFSPAIREGKPTMSVVDVDVLFRIYSKRTTQAAPTTVQEVADTGTNISPVTGKPMLPGLFTVQAELASATLP
ncbi:MAG TPA: energy transducer TonB [Acidobacteriaceae bacterium]